MDKIRRTVERGACYTIGNPFVDFAPSVQDSARIRGPTTYIHTSFVLPSHRLNLASIGCVRQPLRIPEMTKRMSDKTRLRLIDTPSFAVLPSLGYVTIVREAIIQKVDTAYSPFVVPGAFVSGPFYDFRKILTKSCSR